MSHWSLEFSPFQVTSQALLCLVRWIQVFTPETTNNDSLGETLCVARVRNLNDNHRTRPLKNESRNKGSIQFYCCPFPCIRSTYER